MNKRALLVLLCAAFVYGANLWGTSIYVRDEARNAGAAMEMYRTGDWIVPKFNNQLRTDKPPLHYYFMQLGYAIGGITPFAARLFSAVMGVALVVLLYVSVRRQINETAAFWTALITALSVQLAIQFHLAVPDPYLIFFLTAGLLGFYEGYITKRAGFFRLAYFALSLATLAKGPVAVALFGLTALGFVLTQEKLSWKLFARIKVIQGILIFSVVAMPWYALVGLATDGEWLREFFLEHNVGRFTDTREGHAGFPLAPAIIVLLALLPFSFFGPQALAVFWRIRKSQPFLVFASIAILVVAIFFAFSQTLLPSYPEPAVPFFAILLAYYFSTLIEAAELPQCWRISAFLYALYATALPLSAWIAVGQDATLKPLANQTICFAVLPIGAVAALIFFFRKKLCPALMSYSISSFVFLMISFYWVIPQIDKLNPVSMSVSKMNMGSEVYYHKDFHPAFVFALSRSLPPWSRETKPQTPFYIVTLKEHASDLVDLNTRVIHEGKDLFERQVSLVLEVR